MPNKQERFIKQTHKQEYIDARKPNIVHKLNITFTRNITFDRFQFFNTTQQSIQTGYSIAA